MHMGRSLTAVVSAAAAAAAAGDGGNNDELKSSWPEMVGHHMVEAMLIIKSQRQDVILKLLGAGDPQPPDFDAHRVCLFLDGNLIVVRTPVVG